jgi:ribosomal protein S18 acetylase RimI-like enzyme
VSVRRATTADRETLHRLYREFFAELPPPEFYGVTIESELAEVDEIVEDEIAFVAEQDGRPVGFALGRRKEGTRGLLSDIYVRTEARRRGLGTELTRAVVGALREVGATHVTLSVDPQNQVARRIYERWGFRDQALTLAVEIGELEQRLGGERVAAPSFGSVHVQTDDVTAVANAVRQFVPRLPGRSQGSVVSSPRNGWVAVYDELCDREPQLLARLGRELSDRMGAVTLAIGTEQGDVVHYLLYERGRMVDEYLSVPEYHGPLPPGDVIALGANPTVVARLTGAEPREVRAVARTASSPSDLPPAAELLGELTKVMRIEGAEHGYAQARDLPGAVQIAPA